MPENSSTPATALEGTARPSHIGSYVWSRPAGWATRLDFLGRLLLGGTCTVNALSHLLSSSLAIQAAWQSA